MIHLTAKERILLHLYEYVKQADALEVPPGITQEGIAHASDIAVPHFTQYVRPLIQEGLVRERMAHVKSVRRRRKVYDLTDSGKFAAIRLREKVKAETVRVRDAKGVREANVSQVLEDAGGKASLLDVIRNVMETGVVDLADLTPTPQTSFVDFVGDAPKLGKFVGRRAELEAVTKEDGGPRLFVIRGVAGIGKSSFAANACQFVRGKRNLFWHRVRPWDTHQAILTKLGDFLSAMGKPGLKSVLSRGEASRAGEVLRADLPGTRSFLVFDDAHEATPEATTFFRLLKEAVAEAPDVSAMVLTRRALRFYDRRDVEMSGLVREIDLEGLAPAEVMALAADERDADRVLTLGLKLGGHPLFLDLVRAHPAEPHKALRDERLFIEEEIFTQLSDAERRMMKTAALYKVPVPREAVFPDATTSYEVLLSLRDRCLIQVLGEDSFGVHDTIRDFFATVITPSELGTLGAFAIRQLQRLASVAQAAGNHVASIDFLSNALQLAPPTEEQVELREALGDASLKIGDFPGALTAYGEAIKAAQGPEALARLHRKNAFAFEDRGEIASASAEIEEGFRALGPSVSVERGWLDLARFTIAGDSAEWQEAKEHAEASLRTFQSFGVVKGQALSLLALASVEDLRPGGDLSLQERYLSAALELPGSLTDPEVAGYAHDVAWRYYAFGRGDIESASRYLGAWEALAAKDPSLRLRLLIDRGFVNLQFRADYKAAEADFAEAIMVARREHNPMMISSGRFYSALAAHYQGRIDEARRAFEQFVEESRARWPLVDLFQPFLAAECCILQDDRAGFQRIVSAIEEPDLARAVENMPGFADVLRGIDRLIRGDQAGARAAFVNALGRERVRYNPSTFYALYYYGIALRVMGEQDEGASYGDRAIEFLETTHRRALLAVAHERESQLTSTLRTWAEVSQSP